MPLSQLGAILLRLILRVWAYSGLVVIVCLLLYYLYGGLFALLLLFVAVSGSFLLFLSFVEIAPLCRYSISSSGHFTVLSGVAESFPRVHSYTFDVWASI